jgi:phage/plasmid-like protein (TIGR03299 family)
MRQSTWNNIGKEVKTNDPMVALKMAHLDYTVDKQPIYTQFNGKMERVKEKAAIVRDDGYVYGVLGDKYTPLQNRNAFAFLSTISDEMEIVKAGETYTGMVYLIGELPECTVLGDKFKPYICFRTSHNGSCSLGAAITPLRIVCQNQFGFVFKKANNAISIKHSLKMADKMEQAREVLIGVQDYMKSISDLSEQFYKEKISDKKFKQILEAALPIKESMSQRVKDAMIQERLRLVDCYKSDDNANFKGTAWGAVNAYSDFITHKEPKKQSKHFEERRFEKTLFDTKEFNVFLNKLTQIAE